MIFQQINKYVWQTTNKYIFITLEMIQISNHENKSFVYISKTDLHNLCIMFYWILTPRIYKQHWFPLGIPGIIVQSRRYVLY